MEQNNWIPLVCTVMLHESDDWPIKENNAIKLEKNGARMVWWVCNIRWKDKISAVKCGEKNAFRYHVEMFLEQTVAMVWSYLKIEEIPNLINVQSLQLVVVYLVDNSGKPKEK